MKTQSPLDDKAQWCEAHQGPTHEVYPVKRPGTPHWILVCGQCLKTLKDAGLLTFVPRGQQPYKHYHRLDPKLVTNHHSTTTQRGRYELNITKSQVVILRALGYEVVKQ